MEVPVYNITGEQSGSMSVDTDALGGIVNPVLLKQAYVMYHANLRQGSARTKSRGEISVSTRKMYRQKGTGNARHKTRSVPQFRGGGHAKAKKKTRESYRLDMPRKMRRAANRNALLAKLIDNEVRVIDGLSMDTPKTRAIVDFLAKLDLNASVLMALSDDKDKTKNTRLSARNVEQVKLCRIDQLTAFELLTNRYLVVDKADLEAWLGGPWSQTGKDAKLAPIGAQKKGEASCKRFT